MLQSLPEFIFDWTTSFLSDASILAHSLHQVSTAAAAKIARDPIIPQAAYSPNRKWQFGFVLLGLLLAPIGSFLVYWRYYLDGEAAIAGVHFAGLNLGYLLALAIPQRFRDSQAGAKRLAIMGSLLATIALGALPFVGPPKPADLRIPVLSILGGSAGLLTLALLQTFEQEFLSSPSKAVSRSTLLFGLGAGGGTMFFSLLSLLVPDERFVALLACVPLLFLGLIASSRSQALVEHDTPNGRISAGRHQSTLATILFRCFLLVEVGTEWAVAGWLPLYLIGRAGLSPWFASVTLAMYLFLLFFVRSIGLSRFLQWRQKPALLACAAITLVGLLFLSWGSTPSVFLLGTACMALGMAPVLPLAWRDLDERFSFRHDFYRGSLAVAVTGAMTIPFLMGWVQTLFGIRYVMLLPAAGVLVSICLAFLLSFEAHLMVGTKEAGSFELPR